MSERGRSFAWIAVVAAAVAASAYGMSLIGGARSLPADPLAIAPRGASIVLRADAHALRRSLIWRRLTEADEGAGNLRRIERTCGYDPLDQVDEVIVFVRGEGERPFEELGFVARGPVARGAVARERLVECVRNVLSAQGGGMRQVEVEGVPAVASLRGASHAAFLGSDAVIGGDRETVAAIIRASRGDEPSAAADPELRALWDRVAPGRDVVLAGRVPARWRPAIARTAEQMEGDFAALTSVRALGAGASVTSGLALGLAARTESERDAERLAGAMRGWIDHVLAQPLLRVSVLGRALRRVETEPQGRDVVLTGSLTERQLEQALDLWDELRRTPSAPPPGAPSGAPSGAPLADEPPVGEVVLPDEPPVPDEIVGPGAE